MKPKAFQAIPLLAKKLQTCLSWYYILSSTSQQRRGSQSFADFSLMEHFCILNSSLWTVNESSAPTPDQHKKLKGEIGDWQLSTPETPSKVLSIHSREWHEPLTSAELVLAGKCWVSGNWFKRSIPFQDSWIIFKIHFYKVLKEKYLKKEISRRV